MRDLRKVREQSQVRLSYPQVFALMGLGGVALVLSILLGYYFGWSAAKVEIAQNTQIDGPLILPEVESGSISKMLALAAERQSQNGGAITLLYDDLLIGANAKEPSAEPEEDPEAEELAEQGAVVLRGDVTVGTDDDAEGLAAKAKKQQNSSAAVVKDKTAKETEQSEKKQFTLQVSSFQSSEQADSLVMALKERGFEAYKLEAEVNGRIWHRVRVGQFDDKEEARVEVEKLILVRSDLRPMVTTH